MMSAAAAQHTFARIIATRLQAEQRGIAMRWLDRLLVLLSVDATRVFPSANLLDHIPTLIEEIAKFLAAPDTDIADNSFVVAKARELGVLRHEQDASIHQLLKEYELLRGILETVVLEETRRMPVTPDAAEVIGCLRRINQAIAVVMRTTVDTFVERYSETISEQTQRLQRFNRLVSHELRQPLSTLQTAASLISVAEVSGDVSRRQRATAVIQRNVRRMIELLDTITRVSRISVEDDADPALQRVSLSSLIHETWRQLRDSADARGVDLRVLGDLPDVTVDVSNLELLLTNLLSNAIKYSDGSKAHRFVAVEHERTTDAECVLRIADNGIGMNSEQLENLFTPFYRGHAGRDLELGVEGLGLGLGIAQDAAKAIGAVVEVRSSPNEGTTFTVTLPLRPPMTQT